MTDTTQKTPEQEALINSLADNLIRQNNLPFDGQGRAKVDGVFMLVSGQRTREDDIG